MFTGIIEELGRVVTVQHGAAGARIEIACSKVLEDAAPGASIAVNGTCITAVILNPDGFVADLSPETLSKTNLGSLQAGSLVNLERPLRFNGRLDGHFVLGHVDGTSKILSLESAGDGNWWLQIEVPAQLTRYLVSKASVAVDGISLTVAAVDDAQVSFAIIPHTFDHTNLPSRHVGDVVNIEADILAKHLEKLTACR